MPERRLVAPHDTVRDPADRTGERPYPSLVTDRENDVIPPPSKERRWDIDDRGHGVADARAFVTRIEELQRVAAAPDWVAEQPDAHLWPHLERAITAVGSPWMSGSWSIGDDGMLIVELVHAPVDGDRARAALVGEVLRLVGLVIEGSTYIEFEERRSDDEVVVDVVTGMLEDQTPFKGHGHTLRLRARTG